MPVVKWNPVLLDGIFVEQHETSVLQTIIDMALTWPYEIEAPLQNYYSNKDMAFGLFLVNRDIHKRAHKAYLENNKFFLHLVGDLNIGLHGAAINTKCGIATCGAVGPTKFTTGKIQIGHYCDVKWVTENIASVNKMLRKMPFCISLDYLEINLELYSLMDNRDINKFVAGIKKVNVRSRFTLTGYDNQIAPWMRAMVYHLGLKAQPVLHELGRGDEQGEIVKFHAVYVAAKSEEDVTGGNDLVTLFNDPTVICDPLWSKDMRERVEEATSLLNDMW